MKVQKRFLREHKGKNYYKFMINIPPKELKKAEFKEGDELITKSVKGEIKLRKK